MPANRQLERLESVTTSPIFTHFSETQAGISSIRAYKVQHKFIKTMQQNIDENLICSYSNSLSNRWLGVRLDLIVFLITLSAFIFAVFDRNKLDAALAGLSMSTALDVGVYLKQIEMKFLKYLFFLKFSKRRILNKFMKVMSEFEANMTSIERVEEYFKIKPEVNLLVVY